MKYLITKYRFYYKIQRSPQDDKIETLQIESINFKESQMEFVSI